MVVAKCMLRSGISFFITSRNIVESEAISLTQNSYLYMELGLVVEVASSPYIQILKRKWRENFYYNGELFDMCHSTSSSVLIPISAAPLNEY